MVGYAVVLYTISVVMEEKISCCLCKPNEILIFFNDCVISVVDSLPQIPFDHFCNLGLNLTRTISCCAVGLSSSPVFPVQFFLCFIVLTGSHRLYIFILPGFTTKYIYLAMLNREIKRKSNPPCFCMNCHKEHPKREWWLAHDRCPQIMATPKTTHVCFILKKASMRVAM